MNEDPLARYIRFARFILTAVGLAVLLFGGLLILGVAQNIDSTIGFTIMVVLLLAAGLVITWIDTRNARQAKEKALAESKQD